MKARFRAALIAVTLTSVFSLPQRVGAGNLLLAHPWPGNVRQLLNLLEQAVALVPTTMIPASLVQNTLREDASALVPFEEARKQFERDYLVRLLKITGGNVSQAAVMAKRNRTEFYKLLQRHHLEPSMFKEGKSG